MNLGEKIYQLRIEKNLSQGDLADRLDVSRQSVSKWENNTAVPDLDKLIKICDIFEISLDEITGREVPKESLKENPLNKIETIKNSLTKTQLVGCILIGVAIISLLIPFGAVFSPSILVCGLICLTVKKNPWYWCIWVIFIPLLFVIGWAMAIDFICTIIEIAFLVVMSFATYKAFKDTEIVMSRKKAIIILVLSITIDLLYILFHLWNLGVFGDIDTITVILENGQTVTTGKATSGFGYGIMNMLLIAGVGLSYIGAFLSVKNLKRQRGACHSERSEESQL